MFKNRYLAAALIAGTAALSAQAGTAWFDDQSVSYADSQQVTVFNPDGSSYTITPMDVVYVEPINLAFTIEPSSDDYFATLEPSSDLYIVTMSEPIVVFTSGESSVFPQGRDYSTIEANHMRNVDHL